MWNPYQNPPYVGEMITNLTAQGPQPADNTGLALLPQGGMIDPRLLPAAAIQNNAGLVRGQMLWTNPAPPQGLPQGFQMGPSYNYCAPQPQMDPRTYAQWVQMMLAGLGPVLANNVGVRPYRDGESVIAQPTRWSDQQLGLGSTAIAAGATVNITVTNAKRGMIKGLRLTSDTGGASPTLVNSITAAGQTLLAGSTSVPAAFYSMVDSLGNLSSPELMPNSPLVVNITNPGGAPATVNGAFILRVAE